MRKLEKVNEVRESLFTSGTRVVGLRRSVRESEKTLFAGGATPSTLIVVPPLPPLSQDLPGIFTNAWELPEILGARGTREDPGAQENRFLGDPKSWDNQHHYQDKSTDPWD